MWVLLIQTDGVTCYDSPNVIYHQNVSCVEVKNTKLNEDKVFQMLASNEPRDMSVLSRPQIVYIQDYKVMEQYSMYIPSQNEPKLVHSNSPLHITQSFLSLFKNRISHLYKGDEEVLRLSTVDAIEPGVRVDYKSYISPSNDFNIIYSIEGVQIILCTISKTPVPSFKVEFNEDFMYRLQESDIPYSTIIYDYASTQHISIDLLTYVASSSDFIVNYNNHEDLSNFGMFLKEKDLYITPSLPNHLPNVSLVEKNFADFVHNVEYGISATENGDLLINITIHYEIDGEQKKEMFKINKNRVYCDQSGVHAFEDSTIRMHNGKKTLHFANMEYSQHYHYHATRPLTTLTNSVYFDDIQLVDRSILKGMFTNDEVVHGFVFRNQLKGGAEIFTDDEYSYLAIGGAIMLRTKAGYLTLPEPIEEKDGQFRLLYARLSRNYVKIRLFSWYAASDVGVVSRDYRVAADSLLEWTSDDSTIPIFPKVPVKIFDERVTKIDFDKKKVYTKDNNTAGVGIMEYDF